MQQHSHSQLRVQPIFRAFVALCPLVFAAPARADLGFWSAALVGTWRHPSNGDTYQFKPGATYHFRAGAAKRRAGGLSHSGFWKIVQPTEKESGGSMEGPVALQLSSTSRTVSQGGRVRVLPSNRVFRIVVDTVRHDREAPEKNAYRIGNTTWKRLR